MNDPMKIKALREVVRSGIITILAVVDLDKRFLSNFTSSIVAAVNDANLAYGYNEQIIIFIPSPVQIEISERVEEWLVWLRQERGRRDVARLFAWSKGSAIWRLAQAETCNERTINNRIDRSMAAILNEFFDQDVHVEPIDLPIERSKHFPLRGFQLERSYAGYAGRMGGHQRAWIDGVGFMREGKRLRDGRHKAESKELHRDRPR